MKRLAMVAALCAGIATSASAADLLLIDSTGTPVAVLVTGAPLLPDPVFAREDALLAGMMRRMEAAFTAMPFGVPALPGTTVITTSFSDGRTSCSRTVTYDGRGTAAPVMQVRQTGNGCEALPQGRGIETVPAALPAPAPEPDAVTPAAPSGRPQLLRVDYRQPVVKAAPRKG